MNQKRIFIIHGWEGAPESNWFPWLKKQLEKQGFEAIVPVMPNTDNPISSEWLAYMQKIISKPDKNTYLVGHSLGVIAILRFLESLLPEQKIGGAVFVAGFSESVGINETESFFAAPLDYEKIKNSAEKFIAINSDNDPYVPLKKGEILRDKLGAELIIVQKGSHFHEGAGFTELPIVLESLLKIYAKRKI
ncbi:alpha/beta hydrolase [Patescibacteria group bacterium]|nr:alpha/beta hydrolase [Patescibacteria group bacterium]MBU4579894.1 alpha/beta hydrolase [Patescibacteria group bacterium]